MAQSTKRQWATPELRQFKSPDEIRALYGRNASEAQLRKLEDLLKEWDAADRKP